MGREVCQEQNSLADKIQKEPRLADQLIGCIADQLRILRSEGIQPKTRTGVEQTNQSQADGRGIN